MKHVAGWLLLLPAATLLVAFTHYPAAATLLESFFSTGTAVRPSRFVGLANYAGLLADPIFTQVLVNNFWFALGTIPTSIALAMLMAMWVNGALPGRALARLAYFTPTVLPMIAVANLWLYFYTPQIGLLDKLTALFGAASHNWLGNPDTVMGCVIAMTIWKEAGFFMIFYLAALQQMPPDLTEAAAVEGTPRWMFFRRVKVAPFARYVVNTVLLVTMVLTAQLVLCTLAAYAFARLAFPGRDVIFALVL